MTRVQPVSCRLIISLGTATAALILAKLGWSCKWSAIEQAVKARPLERASSKAFHLDAQIKFEIMRVSCSAESSS